MKWSLPQLPPEYHVIVSVNSRSLTTLSFFLSLELKFLCYITTFHENPFIILPLCGVKRPCVICYYRDDNVYKQVKLNP